MLARGTIRRCLAILLVTGCIQTTAAWHASAQDAAPNSFVLGTASTGGTYHPVGVALSTLIKLKLLPEFDLDLTAVNTDGSQQNIELLQQNDVQFAIISALAGHDARTGSGPFANAGANKDLRAITTLWLSTDHLLVRKDVVKSGTVDDFLGLTGRPVSLGRKDSGTLLENRTMLTALGVDIDSTFDLVELGYGESAEALATGRIDGMSVSGGLPIGAVQSVFDRMGGNAAVLEFSDEQLAQIDGGRGVWQRAVIPGGTYPGQDRDIFTIGTPNILAVRADVDEEVVYQITKTIFDELDYLHGLHPTTRLISLDNAVNNLPLSIHEGAVRYFQEEGIELPPPPMALDPDLLVRYPSVEEARADTNQGVVTMFAGTEGDTSTRIAAELAAVLAAADSDVRLLATNGGGIGRNLTDLLYLKGVDTALVRADLLNYVQDQEVYPAIENQVNYISEMFAEEVHLLVGSDIAGLDDLAGKKINLGAPGGGSEITASVILTKLGIRGEPTNFGPRRAIEKLQQGEIAGAFFVGGKPMPLLQQIDADSGLKLLSLPTVQYFDSYRAAEIRGHDYPNLLGADAAVPTIAARTALLTYAWRPDSVRYQALGNLTGALFQNLLTLQDQDYHPKWPEVDPTAEFAGWQRFAPAADWIDDNQGTARRIAERGKVRLEQQAASPSGAGGGQPRLIERDVEAVFAPEGDDFEARTGISDLPSAAVLPPQTEDSADAAALPTTPPAEPVSNDPLSAGVYRGSQATEPTTSTNDLSDLPSKGANAPTF